MRVNSSFANLNRFNVAALTFLWVIILILSACRDKPVDIPADIDPQVLLQALDETQTLEEAAAQFAYELGIDPQRVRARVLPDACTACDAKSGVEFGTLEGLPVAEAAAKVEHGGTVWLFVGNLTCQYAYDGQRYRPETCRLSPL